MTPVSLPHRFARRALVAVASLSSLLACFVVSAPVAAQGRQPSPERGWYATAAITSSSVAVCDIFGCLNVSTADPDTGFALSVGWQLGRHAGIELEYLDAGRPAWGDSSLRYHVDVSGYRLSFLWNFPFRGRWSAYVQGGLASFDARSRVEGFAYPTGSYTRYTIRSRRTRPSLGGGGELRITPEWSLRLGMESSDLDDRLLDARQGTIGTILIGARRSF